jgi:hypothetical protein
MSALPWMEVVDFQQFWQTAVAAKCLNVQGRAGEIPADLPRTNTIVDILGVGIHGLKCRLLGFPEKLRSLTHGLASLRSNHLGRQFLGARNVQVH